MTTLTVALRKEILKSSEILSKETKFNKKECERLLRHFVDITSSSSNHTLDRSKFRNILHNTFNMTDDILMDRVFRAFDKDMDGVINKEEWIRGLSVFLNGSTDQKTKFVFTVYDLNSDGLISREEMFQLLKSSLVKQPTEEDPDEGIRELVEMTFKKLDFDHDGRLTYEDFKAAVNGDMLLLEVLGPCLPEQQVAKAFYATFECSAN